MALDGRFLHDHWTGSMMGVPAAGSKLIGFNNATGKYETTWAYTMSTGLLVGVGESTDGGGTIVFRGTFDEGPAGGGVRTMTMTFSRASPDEFTWEMKDGGANADQGPVMTTTYTRVK
jgi:hypothetical protein